MKRKKGIRIGFGSKEFQKLLVAKLMMPIIRGPTKYEELTEEISDYIASWPYKKEVKRTTKKSKPKSKPKPKAKSKSKPRAKPESESPIKIKIVEI